jgi:valacyclovir hydrolase
LFVTVQFLGVKKYSVLGWSDGGITALMVAANQPENVCKLVVWGANAYITDDELKTYERLRNVDSWGESARKHYLQVYDEKYFRHHFSAWVDAFLQYKTKRNG